MANPIHGLTQLSLNEFEHIYTKNMSSQDVYHYLENIINLRTFREILTGFCSGDDLKEALIQGLLSIDNTSKDSVSKKVRDWLNNSVGQD